MNLMRYYFSITAVFLSISLTLDHSGSWAQEIVNQQSLPLDPNQHMVFMLWKDNPDVQRCGVCHYSPGNEFAKRETDFCRLTELRQWLERDKHAIARQRVEPIDPNQSEAAAIRLRRILQHAGGGSVELPTDWIGASNFLSFAICKQMGYDPTTDAGYAQFRENCMTCHGGYRASQGSDGFTRESSNHPGLSCNYCHQINANSRWIDQHSSLTAKSSWRTLTPQAKADQGMRDLVSVESRAKLCLSCHMGDIEQNMFVTHQMYAAGHPPLPSIELSTLVDSMPRHWRTQAELAVSLADYPQRTEYFLNTFPALRRRSEQSKEVVGTTKSPLPADFGQLPWETETLVGGALGAQQQWLRLVMQAAEPNEPNDSPRTVAWGDYALYDCAACHHELRLPSYRQAVRRTGTPGRPRLLEWPQSLAKSIGLTSPMRETLLENERQLAQAVAERPFGNRESVWQSASAMLVTIEKLGAETADRCWTREFNVELLSTLAQTPEEMLLDYHTARQINWSLRCIDAELARLGQPLTDAVRQRIAKLGLDPVARMEISTGLPSGLGQAIFPEHVRQELEHQSGYDARVFSRQLQELADGIRLSMP